MHFVSDKRDKPPGQRFHGGERMHFVSDKRDKPAGQRFHTEKMSDKREKSPSSDSLGGGGPAARRGSFGLVAMKGHSFSWLLCYGYGFCGGYEILSSLLH
jgi:hypothetical protein